MRQVVLKGDARERGRQLGETFRDDVRAGVEPFTAKALGARRADLAQRYQAVVDYTQQHAPELVAEMRGLAEAARCPFEDVFWRHCQLAIETAGTSGDEPQQCSAFAAVTADAGAVLADTVDFAAPRLPISFYDQRGLVLNRVSPSRGPRYMTVSQAGSLCGGLAMNEAGFACGCLSVPRPPIQRGAGLSYLLIARALASRARTVDEALALLRGWVQLGNAKCWPVIDGHGRYAAIEKACDRTALVDPADGLMVHANDYLSEAMQDLANGDAHSRDRLALLKSRFGAARSKGAPITLRFMAECLQLHGEAGSVCRHGAPGAADDRYHTIAAVLYIPQRRQMQVLAGASPCQAELQTFGFDF